MPSRSQILDEGNSLTAGRSSNSGDPGDTASAPVDISKVEASDSIQSHLSATNSSKRLRISPSASALDAKTSTPNSDDSSTPHHPPRSISNYFRVFFLYEASQQLPISSRSGRPEPSTRLYVFFAVTPPLREEKGTLYGTPVNSMAIGSYLTRSSSGPSGLLEPFVVTSQAQNSTVTLCVWIADSDIQDLESSLGNWKGSVSLLITTAAKPSSPEHHQLVRTVRRLVSRSQAARPSVHLLHVSHLKAPSPNLYLNLARLFSSTDWVLMFPNDLSDPLSPAFYAQATSKRSDVEKSAHLLTPGPNAYPFSPLSPLLLRNDADFWCTERMFLDVTRESDWDECLWQLALQRNGKVDTITPSHQLATAKKVPVQIANEDIGLARQLLSSRFRAEACDTFGKQMMTGHVRNRHRDIMLEGVKAFCLKTVNKKLPR
ncbi:unnamed protein product [Cyclocybe aegerita]|uniref:Uncharacterized protein n=1 Tax=Cyclocybe aegerita TaxID=1973307 RepID=A0A8S0WCJ2_CYCAE|nr:unnamed protein product [Cyclocybe aegerita]